MKPLIDANVSAILLMPREPGLAPAYKYLFKVPYLKYAAVGLELIAAGNLSRLGTVEEILQGYSPASSKGAATAPAVLHTA